MKSYIQDTNDFLKRISNIPPWSDWPILCTIDNIPHGEGLIAIRKASDTRKDKTISSIELADCVRTNIFEHDNLSLSSSEELQ